jgi:hypothetical protein
VQRIVSAENRLLVFMFREQSRAPARLPFPRRFRGDSKPIYVKKLLTVPTHRALGLCWSRCPCDDGAEQITRSRPSQEAQNPSFVVGRRECYTGGAMVIHISLALRVPTAHGKA